MRTDNKVKFVILFLFCALIFLQVSLKANEIVFLKNGDVLYGSVMKENDKYIFFKEKKKTETRSFRRSQVVRVLYNKKKISKSYIYRKDGTSLLGFIVEENAEGIRLRKILARPDEIFIHRSEIASISEKKIESRKEYTFTFNRWAKNVLIEGDFTGWKPVPMERNGKVKNKKSGKWQKNLKIDILKKDEYQYRTIVDDKPEKIRFIKFKMENGELHEDVNLFSFTMGLRIGGGFTVWATPISLIQNSPISM